MLITELLNQYRDLVKYMMKLSGCADYISLTDLARHKSDEPNAVIANWMRNRNTIEYLGTYSGRYPFTFSGDIRSLSRWFDGAKLILFS